ncbi:MAG: serine--tRNA ligase [Candidatus Vogelbacteria bacterium]|nr:serine--tRNA ligase [Candidatus Vogelbacteria bacterium]
MLDIKFIRENPDLIKEAARKKHLSFDVAKLLEVDKQRLTLMTEIEQMRAKQNQVSVEITKAQDPNLRAALIANMKQVKDTMQRRDEALTEIMKSWRELMLTVPNIPDMSVPEGESDKENVELRTWGEPKQFTFKPMSHIDLMTKNDLVDFDRGVKVAGFRGYFLKNEAARMSMAIWQFVMDELVPKGFTPMIVPSLVRKEAFLGTGYLPQGEEDLYKTQDGSYLSGTAEVATMCYFMDEILKKEELPKKMLSFNTCYRREAGSHGKDTKGLYRVHEFNKVEQVVLCEASHETSVKLHEELTANAERLLQALQLPYRVVVNCGGDLGLGQVKKYDIEVWIPSEERYGETHSSSYFHDFQTRRLNIRYRDEADGKLRFAHSLNNTALATPRLLISIIENYQNEDGTISVPEVLKKYIGTDLISRK